MASVIDTTFLYDADCSVVLLRPRNEVKLLTQSALGQLCMGKRPVPSLAELFLGLQKGPRRSNFSGAPFATNAIPEKNSMIRQGDGDETIQKPEMRSPMFADVAYLKPSF